MTESNRRPWGKYIIIEQTKIIDIKPNQSLSLQYHDYRDENWEIQSGEGKVSIDGILYNVHIGDKFEIKKHIYHRAIAGKKGMNILERSTGIIDEDDIVRLEDNYGRVKNK
jgi:mannose-6-phosphate isomerase-like protein (cupin superfamily)